ncbi:MAG: hypothetical protein RLY87_667 [Chloroflexota bacterium]|jgi:uncharacterized protein YdeI (YjbR/CyaY-like superfamily)
MNTSDQHAGDKTNATKHVEIFFESRSAFRQWLTEHTDQTSGIWVIFYKKSTGMSDVSWDAIVEECLCFGWIDSLPGKVDDSKTKIYVSPRKKNSGWSQRNKRIIVELVQRGLMTESGRRVIARAKANGSWIRFDMAEQLILSEELKEIFTADPAFAARWDTLTDARKRQVLQHMYDAKTEATRLGRIDQARKSIQT